MHNTWLYIIQRKIYYKQSLIVVFFLFFIGHFFSHKYRLQMITQKISDTYLNRASALTIWFFLSTQPLKALWNYKGFMFFLCNALMLLVNTVFCNSNYSFVSFLMESQCINYTTFPLSYVYNYLGVTLQVCMYKSKFLHLKEFKKNRRSKIYCRLLDHSTQYISEWDFETYLTLNLSFCFFFRLNRKTEGLLLHEL